ncbi:MAG: hypothetical protein RMK29_17105 [Myxococcales bacterium]|nr:hypothetical protein [Myxococcota bacterium]MDW8283428.1 hypothetical protein [Myxococcales bacterium]
MFNLRMGGAFGVYYGSGSGYYYVRGPDFFVLQPEAGFAVTKDRNGYLLAPVQFELTPGLAVVMLPFGFQYDIPLPVPGLYLTPRISGGYAAWVSTGYVYGPYYGGYYGATSHTGFMMPEFGAKYVIKGRINAGGELFSLPIFFGPGGAAVQYRVLFYGGINL